MLIVFALICLILVLIYMRFKSINIALIIMLALLILVQSSSINMFVTNIIALFSQVVLSKAFLILVLILVLINCITELILFMGQHHILEEQIAKQSPFVQKIYVHLASSLSTNVNFRTSKVINENLNIFESSSFLMSTLMVISIPFLMVFFFIYPTFAATGDFSNIVVALLVSNFFAIYWLAKRIIDFKFERNHKYYYHTKHLLLEEDHVTHVNETIFLKWFFMRSLVVAIVVILLSLVTDINFLIFALLALVFIFVDLFINVEVQAYKTKSIREKDLYYRLFYAIKKITSNLATFILGVLFISEATALLNSESYYEFNGLIIMMFIFVILGVVATYYTKKYIVGFLIAIPLFSVFMLNYPFSSDFYLLILIIQGVLMFTYFLSIIHIDFKNTKQLKELSYMALAGFFSYFLLFLTGNFVISLLALLVFLLINIMKLKRAR